jgi:membrane associated rhomboid family serine protease
MGLYDRPYYQDESRPAFSMSGRTMVLNLIIINVLVFVVDAFFFSDSSPFRPSQVFAVKPGTLFKPWLWWQFLTYGFCHSPNDVGHILGNMLGLFFLGQEVEYHYGRRRFLWMYLTTLIVCSITWSATEVAFGRMNASLIGASGAVTAVVLLFALNFPRRTILFMMFIPMPAWILGVMLVVFNLMGVRGESQGQVRIAYDVHLMGALYAFVFFKSGWTLMGQGEGWMPKIGWPQRKPKLRVHDPESRLAALDEQADAVLDKLHRQGQESLTASERKILEEYSRRMQQRRR